MTASPRPPDPVPHPQAQYLRPDPAAVDRLSSLLSEKKIGVVAHFYMDPQVQGVLSSAAERWPHINISDSLVMADGAVKMVEAGCRWASRGVGGEGGMGRGGEEGEPGCSCCRPGARSAALAACLAGALGSSLCCCLVAMRC